MNELEGYQAMLDALWAELAFAMAQAEKEARLLSIFSMLHQHHMQNSLHYARMFGHLRAPFHRLNDVPYLAVRLFKQLMLTSVPTDDVFKRLQSSGTTSSQPSTVVLDKATSARQSKSLVKIMQDVLGNKRLPMLIIDSPVTGQARAGINARAAGVQGLSFLGRDHTYALDEQMQLNLDAIRVFADNYQGQPVLLFGFTFMVWLHFIQALKQQGQTLSLPHGILLHSGGWKKLVEQQVTNAVFKEAVGEATGIQKVHNFYGMAEQVGTVFVECEQGFLHAPNTADVIIRDPYTLAICEPQKEGLIQVLSVLPTSYPGYSILTEDLGRLYGVDNCPCGRKGCYFSVNGRLPKTEVRGCSDTYGAKF